MKLTVTRPAHVKVVKHRAATAKLVSDPCESSTDKKYPLICDLIVLDRTIRFYNQLLFFPCIIKTIFF